MAMMDMFGGKGKPSGGKPQMASKGGLYMKPAAGKPKPAPVSLPRRGMRRR